MIRKLTTGAIAAGVLCATGSAAAQAQIQRRHDLVFQIAPGSLASLVLDGVPGIAVVEGGAVSVRLDGDSACAANPTSGCPATLNNLRVAIGDITGLELNVDGNIDIVDIVDPDSVVLGLNSSVHDGAAFAIPTDSPTSSLGRIFGEVAGQTLSNFELLQQSALPPGLSVGYTLVPSQIAVIDGALPVTLDIAGNILTGSIDLMASASTPFTNTPPLAFAGSNTTVQCGQAANLDATQTVDQEGNSTIVAYRWLDDTTNALLASTAVAQVTLPAGNHVVRLEVQDVNGAIGRDFVNVDVQGDAAPQFSFVPPDLMAEQCGPLQIGSAVAASVCGPAVVTSNAPSSFFAGRTTVTWTATSQSGLTATATQLVFVELGNSPSCCPPGSNVILGNSNNNTLNGTSGDDCILGFGAQDTINGGGGNDIISGGDGNDVIDSGPGNDVLSGGTGQDQLSGGTGDDFVAGNDGDDVLRGLDGNDLLKGGQGQDSLFGGAGTDRCLGGTGDDQLFGDAGDDLLDGEANNDSCTGGAGFDTMLSCTAQDAAESTGTPPFPGTPNYNVCECKPNKCNDCSAPLSTCQAASGCAQIIECIKATPGCNLPHECSPLCESGRSSQAIDAARQLASCFGGC